MSDEEWKIVRRPVHLFGQSTNNQFISRELADFLEDRMSDLISTFCLALTI
jgi:hypothetical protein